MEVDAWLFSLLSTITFEFNLTANFVDVFCRTEEMDLIFNVQAKNLNQEVHEIACVIDTGWQIGSRFEIDPAFKCFNYLGLLDFLLFRVFFDFFVDVFFFRFVLGYKFIFQVFVCNKFSCNFTTVVRD